MGEGNVARGKERLEMPRTDRSRNETSCVRTYQRGTTQSDSYGTYAVVADVVEVVGFDELPDCLNKVFDCG